MTCRTCGGEGFIEVARGWTNTPTGPEQRWRSEDCDACEGTGEVPNDDSEHE